MRVYTDRKDYREMGDFTQPTNDPCYDPIVSHNYYNRLFFYSCTTLVLFAHFDKLKMSPDQFS